MLRASWIAAIVVVASCGPKSTDGPPTGQPGSQEAEHLTIPPSTRTEAALSRLSERADSGSVPAAWARAHFLLDAFDDARFRKDDRSLAVLTAAMDLDPERGADATNRAVSGLLIEVDRVLALDRTHSAAQQARVLLEFDGQPPARRSDVFQRMVELKTIARGGGPLSSNAVLRLAGYCINAIADAKKAPRRARALTLSHCLYPVFDSDPEPYFAELPGQRPPPPRLAGIGPALLELLGAARRQRLSSAQDSVTSAAEALVSAGHVLPVLPDFERGALASVATAVPYDWTPLLDLGDGSRLESAQAYAKALESDVLHDGRGRLAASIMSHAPGAALIRAAETAVAARAHTLELLVVTRQKLSVPPGDYWSERMDGDEIARHAVVSLSLATMPGGAARAARKPRGVTWDPSRATLSLHLIVTPARWTLLSPQGEIARIDADKDPVADLRAHLDRIRRAFPDEDGLMLVPGVKSSAGALIAAASGATHRASGAPLFSRLALAPTAPKIAGRTLARRVKRRARAKVEVRPEELSTRAPIARRCFQRLLEQSPRLAGEVRIELDGEATKVVEGPKNKKLRACASSAVAAAMVKGKFRSAIVSFSLSEK